MYKVIRDIPQSLTVVAEVKDFSKCRFVKKRLKPFIWVYFKRTCNAMVNQKNVTKYPEVCGFNISKPLTGTVSYLKASVQYFAAE